MVLTGMQTYQSIPQQRVLEGMKRKDLSFYSHHISDLITSMAVILSTCERMHQCCVSANVNFVSDFEF